MAPPVFPTVSLPTWPVTRSQMWSTLKQPAISGKEIRVQLWSFPRYKYQIVFDILRTNVNSELQDLMGFINSVGGAALPFYYNDPNDNTVNTQVFAIGDGATTAFQLIRSFGGFAEPVQSPNVITNIEINGTPSSSYSLGAGGIVNFATAPGAGTVLTWTGTFYWMCKFDDDVAEFSQFNSTMYEMKKLSFTTVKL